MALVRLTPERQASALAQGFVVPRGTRLASRLGPRLQTRCVYTTAHTVTLWPLDLVEARLLDAAAMQAASLPRPNGSRAAFLLRLRTFDGMPVKALGIDRLCLHLRPGDGQGFRLYEALLARQQGLAARAPAGSWRLDPEPERVRRKGFVEAEALLPAPPETFEGWRLLREYFTFPARFLFVELTGLAGLLADIEGDTMEIAVPLTRADMGMVGSLGVEDVALFVTPAVNLFERMCDPVPLDHRRPAHHVVADRTRPRDFEIHSVLDVTADGGAAPAAFAPMYRQPRTQPAGGAGAYFTVERRPRLVPEREQGLEGQTGYRGEEVWLGLTGAAPPAAGHRHLIVTARCTNRDLPMLMPLLPGESHFSLDTGAPVATATCLGEPTRPRPALARNEIGTTHGETAWRLIGHLCPNYLTLLDGLGEEGARSLRELLALYAALADPAAARQIEGVRHVHGRPVVERLPGGGPIAFGRGLEVELSLEERLFDGTSAFLLGAVLEVLFRRWVAVNAFTRTVVTTLERGEIMRWPARIGERHLA
jgi:type VI secretion system protein ImpG